MLATQTKFFLVLAFLAFVATAFDNAEHEAKRQIIKRESALVADALRNISRCDIECKNRVERMANDLILSIPNWAYAFNSLIPNVPTTNEYNLLWSTSQQMHKAAYAIIKDAYGSFAGLKQILVSLLEQVKVGVIVFEQEYRILSEFSSIQLNRKNTLLIYAIYKLKYEIEFINKSNSELQPEIESSADKFVQAVESLSNNKKTKEALWKLSNDLATVIERCVYKLQNWIEINQNDTQNVEIVKTTSRTISIIYSKLIVLASEDETLPPILIKNVVEAFQEFIGQILQLSEVKYSGSLGGEEFIRSSLFDAITISRTSTESLERL